MASLDDILTTQKNGVVGVNGLNQTFQRAQGTNTSTTVTSSTLVVTGKGYLVNVSVLVPGSTDGLVHNATTTAAASAINALCVVPNINGVFPIGQVFTNGLVLVPGTGQSLNVTYSLS